ncbi:MULTISPECIES: hypothetical protein [unclassified Streptomyces]|uniref:hypothetical protein n=1 Tax=unclassified Streptomyces TaxID=2593676 RepID=UPI0005AB1CE2|nr:MULTISPECIES: hypothetical protein [unclassified Streptomyces]ODA70904.1 hypothetical protein APS67_004908 [Streptomyces sp. AVP053U2]
MSTSRLSGWLTTRRPFVCRGFLLLVFFGPGALSLPGLVGRGETDVRPAARPEPGQRVGD